MKPNQFFKIITACNVQQNNLMIPRKFIEAQGNNFRDFVLLKVPSGAVWPVELTNLKGYVWLCKGWKKFAEYYSLLPGHLLIFKYKGNSNFNVVIFDKCALEIEYPFTAADHFRVNTKNVNLKGLVKEEAKENASVHILENSLMNDSFSPTRKVKEEHDEGKSGALQRARAFKSNKPFFIVRMGTSYVSGKSFMCIPTSFEKTQFSKEGSNVVLQVSDGRKWYTKYTYEKGTTKCRICMKSFARDNNARVGDVCVFELIDHVKPRLNVNIFRAL